MYNLSIFEMDISDQNFVAFHTRHRVNVIARFYSILDHIRILVLNHIVPSSRTNIFLTKIQATPKGNENVKVTDLKRYWFSLLYITFLVALVSF